MALGLDVNDVVTVGVSFTQTGAGYRNFGALLILGNSDVIDVVSRRRQYADLSEVAADFGTTVPEYQAASLFFSQDPTPNLVYIGRWAQTATSGRLNGASLTPAQRLLTLFTTVTSGSMLISVDGVPYALTGLNFSSALNLNGVAAIIDTALTTAGATNPNVFWDANNFRFVVESGTTGVASLVGYGAAPTAVGSINFVANPTASSTIALNGTVVTFVTSAPTGNQVLIGASTAATLANLLAFLRSSSDTQIVKFQYSVLGSKLYLTAVASGTTGNSLTLAASVATVSGATLTGGSGTDVSVLLGLSITPNSAGANANVPVAGSAPETLASAVSLFDANYGDWYALQVATATPPSDSDNIAVASYIQGLTRNRIYLISTQNTTTYDPTRSDDLASVLHASAFDRTAIDFSTSSLYPITSLFGIFATIQYSGSDTTKTAKFKIMPGVIPESLNETQAATLDAKGVNYYTNYQNGVAIVQQGVMVSGRFIDSRINADWLANYVQTNAFNVLVALPKVPQTDAGMNLLKASMTDSMQQAVTNGFLAPGVWNGPSFGTLQTGDFLPAGFYIYAPLVANQSETDRAARKSVPFQIAAKEAGAVHSANIMITVNP